MRGGHSANVIPGEVTVDLDCRLLPGFSPADVFAELRTLARVDMELEVLRHDPAGPASLDMALFETLAGILRELDPSARPVPMLLPAVTDGRFFARLGIQTYGFLPMQLPSELRFMKLITPRTSGSRCTASSSAPLRSAGCSSASRKPSRDAVEITGG